MSLQISVSQQSNTDLLEARVRSWQEDTRDGDVVSWKSLTRRLAIGVHSH